MLSQGSQCAGTYRLSIQETHDVHGGGVKACPSRRRGEHLAFRCSVLGNSVAARARGTYIKTKALLQTPNTPGPRMFGNLKIKYRGF